MQSTLDRKVLYLMLRGARRQEAARRQKPAPRGLPARLTGDGWWLDAPPAQTVPRITEAPRLVAANGIDNPPAKVTAQGDSHE
ncbi:MAG: hypothetical protein K2Z80_35305 [Xanthobacteraceae bacterium]|nr:hypothetical protein [Xanthobacteraceae bacterium]